MARGEHERVVEVLAAGLHHLTRSKAEGTHCSATGVFPTVPCVDAVVREPSGRRLRYAILDDTDLGTFAERTVIDVRRSIVLPDGADPVRIAAVMNPGMSSWVALRRRIDFRAGQRVLVLGATGSAGRMAVQIAKRFGAAEVFAVGRNAGRPAELPALGADRALTFEEIAAAADVDVVLDFVRGEPAAGAMLEIVGSGIGSLSARDFLAELPELASAVTEGALDVRARAVAPSGIGEAWNDHRSDERLVYVP
ncbi:zinc-binding alcohol dehydrogenase family protein [Streptomyces sp. IBSBF 3010]|uniref:zinc-binding alcohol dehydrogenase family protein n=1 Tax=Streptomyces sp. IBSBF 3010 TaxID=2903526 RepID=UPI002FDBE483